MSAKTAKQITKNVRARNWTSAEVTLFAEVSADEEYNFAPAFEELALKKATMKFLHLSKKYLTKNVGRIIL